MAETFPNEPGVYLYWIPLGAGGRVVRLSGRLFETLTAVCQRRPRRELFHSALVAVTDEAHFVIEMTPIWRTRTSGDRGVVATGPVGSSLLGRFRLFRYEVRRWRSGIIPDMSFAVGGPPGLAVGDAVAERVLHDAHSLPAPVWGRDELRAGEMWNSNSVTAWLLQRAGIDASALSPPNGGRAPGWRAGIVVARRDDQARVLSHLTA
jgi:hypothetical protein